VNCRIVYYKFHVLQHANKAIDEVRRAEFFRKGGRMRGVVKGKCWLLLTRWMNLDQQKRQQLNELFALNRRVMKAYLLKESLERLWTYRYEEAMVRYLQSWIDQLRWQRLPTTVLETVVRPLETVAALQRFENRRPNQSFAGRPTIRSEAQGGMRQQSVGSALSSVDPMQVIGKIVSRIDTVRCRNWPRRLILHV
jgi:hypothetical protein